MSTIHEEIDSESPRMGSGVIHTITITKLWCAFSSLTLPFSQRHAMADVGMVRMVLFTWPRLLLRKFSTFCRLFFVVESAFVAVAVAIGSAGGKAGS